MGNEKWLLPDGVSEVLPPLANRVERLRRGILDLFEQHGYELIIPPMVEYLDSLLTGSGTDLDLQTFKVIDQRSGRMLGLRADISSQAARMDARSYPVSGPSRLCYVGTVLHTTQQAPFESRCPIKVGAELFGDDSRNADAEVVALMAAVVDLAGVSDVRLELGHVGIFRTLAQLAGLQQDTESEVFECLQRKSAPDIAQVLGQAGVSTQWIDAFVALPAMLGDADVLTEARRVFTGMRGVEEALEDLEQVATLAAAQHGLQTQFDLAELRGYSYHTGVVFAAYTADQGRAIARGGRYDEVGKEFGRARPATGFDADLLNLAEYLTEQVPAGAVFAPLWDVTPGTEKYAELNRVVVSLRAAGERVICGREDDAAIRGACDRRLNVVDGAWKVVSLTP